MLWGQKLQVFINHKNPRVNFRLCFQWRLLLEEYGPKIVHIKGIHNTVADAISKLDFGMVQDEKANWMTFRKCWCHNTMHAPTEEITITHQHQINMVFANCSKEM